MCICHVGSPPSLSEWLCRGSDYILRAVLSVHGGSAKTAGKVQVTLHKSLLNLFVAHRKTTWSVFNFLWVIPVMLFLPVTASLPHSLPIITSVQRGQGWVFLFPLCRFPPFPLQIPDRVTQASVSCWAQEWAARHGYCMITTLLAATSSPYWLMKWVLVSSFCNEHTPSFWVSLTCNSISSIDSISNAR